MKENEPKSKTFCPNGAWSIIKVALSEIRNPQM